VALPEPLQAYPYDLGQVCTKAKEDGRGMKVIVWNTKAVLALLDGEPLMANCSLCAKEFNIIRYRLQCPCCGYDNLCSEVVGEDAESNAGM